MKAKLTYFKPYGKYYTEAEYDFPVEHVFQLSDAVIEMNLSGEPMPGLCGKWNGPILITGPTYGEGSAVYPMLILDPNIPRPKVEYQKIGV